MALKVDRRHENTNEEVQLALQFQRLQANESHERPKGENIWIFKTVVESSFRISSEKKIYKASK